MQSLKEKSKFNFDAAELLIKANLYAPSVHCSYFSCFQLLKFVILDFFEEKEHDLETKIKHQNKGSHNYIIDYCVTELYKNKQIESYNLIKNKMKQLKKFRKNSDYDVEEITVTKSSNAHKFAELIRNEISKTFNL